MTCRYKILPSGRRQTFYLPYSGRYSRPSEPAYRGDDHNLVALVTGRLGFIPHHLLRAFLRDHPRITDVFWRDTLIEAAIFREWIANVGSRNARSRMAHLFCEMYVRLRAAGAIPDDSSNFLFRSHKLSSVTRSGYPPFTSTAHCKDCGAMASSSTIVPSFILKTGRVCRRRENLTRTTCTFETSRQAKPTASKALRSFAFESATGLVRANALQGRSLTVGRKPERERVPAATVWRVRHPHPPWLSGPQCTSRSVFQYLAAMHDCCIPRRCRAGKLSTLLIEDVLPS